MNAIVISAIMGVVMMFSGILSKKSSAVRYIATAGLIILVVCNSLELSGSRFFEFDVHSMLSFDSFGLLFNTIAFASTLIFVLLSGRDMEKVGVHVAEYY